GRVRGKAVPHGGSRRQRCGALPRPGCRAILVTTRRLNHREFSAMTARFSSESFEHSQGPAICRDSDCGQIAPDPAAGYEALLARVVEEPADFESPALEADEIYVPDPYEPNYAYPLIVWLSPHTAPRPRLQRLMQTVSERNYFGVTVPVVDGEMIEEQLFETFSRLRRRYHLHTERVYLLGFGDFGTQALKVALSRPAWFAGVAAISA